MSEHDFEVGDVVEVLDSQREHSEGESFFKVGDRGVIVSNEYFNFSVVNFNNCGNASVEKSGVWFVQHENIKLISQEEV